jgi:hypothetical protein
MSPNECWAVVKDRIPQEKGKLSKETIDRLEARRAELEAQGVQVA